MKQLVKADLSSGKMSRSPSERVPFLTHFFLLGGFPQNRPQKEVGTLILSFLLEDLDVETR